MKAWTKHLGVCTLLGWAIAFAPASKATWYCDPCCKCDGPKAIEDPKNPLALQSFSDDEIATQATRAFAQAGLEYFGVLQELEAGSAAKAGPHIDAMISNVAATIDKNAAFAKRYKNPINKRLLTGSADEVIQAVEKHLGGDATSLKYPPLRAKLAQLGTQEYAAMIEQYQATLSRARESAERVRDVIRKNEIPTANQITSLGNAWVDVQLTAQALSLIVGTVQAPFVK